MLAMILLSDCRLKRTAPIEYIQFIHEKLFAICQYSGLEGLEYYGGPEVVCEDCSDDGEGIVLRCVEYNTDCETATKADNAPTCDRCKVEFDVNKLLNVSADIVHCEL